MAFTRTVTNPGVASVDTTIYAGQSGFRTQEITLAPAGSIAITAAYTPLMQSQITSGVLTEVVTPTAPNRTPDREHDFFPTNLMLALLGANAPSAANPFATILDLGGGGGGALATLSDVQLGALTNGDLIAYSVALSKWVNVSAIAAAFISYNNAVSGLASTDVQAAIDELVTMFPSPAAMSTLTDADLTGLVDDDILQYDLASTKWKPVSTFSASKTSFANAGTGLVATDVQAAIVETLGRVFDAPIYASPRTVYVDPQHPFAADDADINTPFVTIMGAINAVTASGAPAVKTTIMIAAGVYAENIVIKHTNINLRGQGYLTTEIHPAAGYSLEARPVDATHGPHDNRIIDLCLYGAVLISGETAPASGIFYPSMCGNELMFVNCSIYGNVTADHANYLSAQGLFVAGNCSFTQCSGQWYNFSEIAGSVTLAWSSADPNPCSDNSNYGWNPYGGVIQSATLNTEGKIVSRGHTIQGAVTMSAATTSVEFWGGSVASLVNPLGGTVTLHENVVTDASTIPYDPDNPFAAAWGDTPPSNAKTALDLLASNPGTSPLAPPIEYGSNPVLPVGTGTRGYYPTILYFPAGFAPGTDVIAYKYICVYEYIASGSLAIAGSNDMKTWVQCNGGAGLVGLVATAGHPTIVQVTGGFRIYYNDGSIIYDVASCRTAFSTDLVNWSGDTQLLNGVTPIITGVSPNWNRGSYGVSHVAFNPTATNTGADPRDYSYMIYYNGTTGGDETLGLGYSADGITFECYGEVLGLAGPGAWDEDYSGWASIIDLPNGWKLMFYSGGNNIGNHAVGTAISPNGLVWTRLNPTYPLLGRVYGTWHEQRCYAMRVIADFVTKFNGDGDTVPVKMLVSGRDNAGNYTSGYFTLDFLSGTEQPLNHDNFRVTPEGGFAVRMVNATGSTSVKGTLVSPSTTVDGEVIASPASNQDTVGIVYEDGIPNTRYMWVVIGGIADVLIENANAVVNGDWLGTSTVTAGRAIPVTGEPVEPQQSAEIGHAIQAQASGTNVLARAILHFN